MSENVLNNGCHESLQKFGRIKLKDVPKGMLMERFDRKYLFHEKDIGKMISGLEKDYSIVEAAGEIISPYHSQYFDTNDFIFFKKHHSGYGNRSKVRFRTYPKTNTSFFEHKVKNSKGRTAKSRVNVETTKPEIPSELYSFLSGLNDDVSAELLAPSVEINYQRVGFVAKQGDERFSLDLNISASYRDKNANFGNAAILEVKQDYLNVSPVIRHLRSLGMTEVSMSKYCLSLCKLTKHLKHNRFKPALRKLDKLNQPVDD